jgi:hypothetical protein
MIRNLFCTLLVLLLSGCSGKQEELANPWKWMPDQDLGWAVPALSPADAANPRLGEWGFSLYEPVGRYEIHRIPEHLELCITIQDNQWECNAMTLNYEAAPAWNTGGRP